MKASPPNLLETWILEKLAGAGPVPFERFMEWALYHPEYGYYVSGRAAPGRDEGDFTTAPHISLLFGRCLANLLMAADERLGRPTPFVFVEGGAGEGRLARDVLDTLQARAPELYRRLEYCAEESSPVWGVRQKALLEPHTLRLRQRPPQGYEGLYLSNELVDAFPVHRLERRNGRLEEVYVGAEDGRLVEVPGPLSRPELASHLGSEGVELVEGQQVEVNLRALDWIREVGERIRRGFVVTIDYGDEDHRLYGPHRPKGTCMAYRGQRASEDLLASPGEQDLTAHVDFTALRRAGAEAGLAAAPLLTQREFLFRFGFLSEVEAMETWGLPEAELAAARRRLAPLLFPEGMGDSFKVLLQGKGISPTPLLAERSLL